jgi:hypothetical protein
MRTDQTLSTWWRLAALGASVMASTLVMVAAMLPFWLDSPERGEAIVAREAALQAVRVGAASAPARQPPGQVRAARNDTSVDVQ